MIKVFSNKKKISEIILLLFVFLLFFLFWQNSWAKDQKNLPKGLSQPFGTIISINSDWKLIVVKVNALKLDKEVSKNIRVGQIVYYLTPNEQVKSLDIKKIVGDTLSLSDQSASVSYLENNYVVGEDIYAFYKKPNKLVSEDTTNIENKNKTSAKLNSNNTREKLLELKKLFDEGLINKNDYEKTKEEILKTNFISSSDLSNNNTSESNNNLQLSKINISTIPSTDQRCLPIIDTRFPIYTGC